MILLKEKVMKKEDMLAFAKELQTKLEELHDMCASNKDKMSALEGSLIISLFMNDKPIYMSVQGEEDKLCLNLIKLLDEMKENVWKHNSKK